MFKLMEKEIITILLSIFLLNWTYDEEMMFKNKSIFSSISNIIHCYEILVEGILENVCVLV